MNTLIISKPLVATIAISGVAAIALTAQLAFSQGEPSSLRSSLALEAAAAADTDSPFEAPEARLTSEANADANPLEDTNSTSESKALVKDVVVFAGQSYVPPKVIDLKPRTPSELRIEAALPLPLSDFGLEFEEAPLNEVAGFLQDEYNIPIVVDYRALQDEGIAQDEPITVNLRDIKLESALRLMLSPLNLTYIVKDEVLLITSVDQAAATLETRAYPIEFLNASSDELNKLITSTVAPNTWSKVWGLTMRVVDDQEQGWLPGSGAGNISAQIPDRLIIRQTYAVHQEINELLSQLKNSTDDSNEAQP